MLGRHLIALLHHDNLIQILNKITQIHNLAVINLWNSLADKSMEFLVDRKRIKVVHHINILIKYSTHIFTEENYSIIPLDFRKLDEIATTCMDYDSNEILRTKYSHQDYKQSETRSPSAKKYTFLTQFGIPTDLLNPTNRDTIRSILRCIEKLNSEHNLSFMHMNSTTTKPF